MNKIPSAPPFSPPPALPPLCSAQFARRVGEGRRESLLPMVPCAADRRRLQLETAEKQTPAPAVTTTTDGQNVCSNIIMVALELCWALSRTRNQNSTSKATDTSVDPCRLPRQDRFLLQRGTWTWTPRCLCLRWVLRESSLPPRRRPPRRSAATQATGRTTQWRWPASRPSCPSPETAPLALR